MLCHTLLWVVLYWCCGVVRAMLCCCMGGVMLLYGAVFYCCCKGWCCTVDCCMGGIILLLCCCMGGVVLLYGRCCLVIMMVISCRGLNIGAQGIAPAAQPAATTSSGSYFSSKSCLNQAHIFERGPNFWILRMLTLGSFALFCFCCQWQSLDSCKLTAEVRGWYCAGVWCLSLPPCPHSRPAVWPRIYSWPAPRHVMNIQPRTEDARPGSGVYQ